MVDLDSRWIFTLAVAAVACERLVELVVSRRHERILRGRGAVEVGASHYPWMVALHTSFLAAGPLEAWLFGRPFIPWLGWIAAAVVAATMALRYWTIRTLGTRWTTRVLVLSEAPLVEGGPFRWLRHPNYLAVALELFALPLIHGAYGTALIWGILNLWLLKVRISIEDHALRGASPSAVKVF
ncbi:MAG: isoprenylcysteine carboxylmethyltransferase family protein [Acidobacteriota bacterium]